jgi:DNA-binding transcriptional ArsR family regulator
MAIERLARKSAEASRLLKALASRKRLKLLCALANREMRAGDLSGTIGCTQSGTSQHLSWLKDEGLVNARSDGQCVYYSLTEGTDALLRELLLLTRDDRS